MELKDLECMCFIYVKDYEAKVLQYQDASIFGKILLNDGYKLTQVIHPTLFMEYILNNVDEKYFKVIINSFKQ
jgi:hypothetical protein